MEFRLAYCISFLRGSPLIKLEPKRLLSKRSMHGSPSSDAHIMMYKGLMELAINYGED